MSEEDQRNENDANPMNPNSNTAQPEKKSKRQLKKERKLAREENATMDGSNPETTKPKRPIDPTKNATVFLGQLSRDTSEDQIRDFFKQHDIEVRDVRMMREKETNKFRGMAFVDIPDGCVCKALELHRTYFNGKQINVEETKNGGKHSAKKKDFISRMRKLHNERTREQNNAFIEEYLKAKKAKFVWSEFDQKARDAVVTFPKDDMKKILDSLLKTNFTKVRDKNTFLMGIVRRVRKEATEKNE